MSNSIVSVSLVILQDLSKFEAPQKYEKNLGYKIQKIDKRTGL